MNKKRILVVDDDAVMLKALSIKLKGAGYEVLLADDGGAAVSAARQSKPDLILLDITFPPDIGGGVSWDGFLILNWVRRLDEARNIPVIMVSADNSAKAQDQARKAGAFEFCTKPIDWSRLLGAIARATCPAVPASA